MRHEPAATGVTLTLAPLTAMVARFAQVSFSVNEPLPEACETANACAAFAPTLVKRSELGEATTGAGLAGAALGAVLGAGVGVDAVAATAYIANEYVTFAVNVNGFGFPGNVKAVPFAVALAVPGPSNPYCHPSDARSGS